MQEHVIDKYSIEYTFSPSFNKADIDNSLLSRKENILRLLNKIFDTYFSDGYLVEIDKIQLDIGNVTLANYSSIFESRIESLLIAEFEKLVKTKSLYVNKKILKSAQDTFYLLEQYLLYGFNAVLQQDPSFNLDEYIAKLLNENAPDFIELIQKNKNNAYVLKRIMQLKPETIDKIRKLTVLPASNFLVQDKDRQFFWDQILLHLQTYFKTGQYDQFGSGVSLVDINQIVRNLIQYNGTVFFSFLYENLSDETFLHRISEVLTLQTLISGFQKTDQLSKHLIQWRYIENLFAEWGYAKPETISHRVAFLEYLSLPFDSDELKSMLLYNQLIKYNTVFQTSENFKRYFVDNNNKAIPGIHLKFIEHLKDVIDKERGVDTDLTLFSDTDIFVYYLTFGIIKSNDVDFDSWLDKLLGENSEYLIVELSRLWKNENVRYRLAHHFQLNQIDRLIQKMWGTHYTYEWFNEIITKTILHTTFPIKKQIEKLVRELTAVYFDFLAANHGENWLRTKFEDWILMQLIHTFNNQPGNSPWNGFTFQINEIFTTVASIDSFDMYVDGLTQKTNTFVFNHISKDHFQFYFEHIIGQEDFIRETFFSSLHEYEQWKQFFDPLTTAQLNRFIATVVAAHELDFMNNFLEEITQYLSLKQKQFDSNLIARSFYLFSLRTIYKDKSIISKDYFAQLFLEYLLKEYKIEMFVEKDLFAIDLGRLRSQFPVLYSAAAVVYTRNEQIKINYFNAILLTDFPETAGFVTIYLLALDIYFKKYASGSADSINTIYTSIYHYLLNNKNNFSASLFVRIVTAEFSRLLSKQYEEVQHVLLEISNNHFQNGDTRFYVLKEVFSSEFNFDADLMTEDFNSVDVVELRQILSHLFNKVDYNARQFYANALNHFIESGNFIDVSTTQAPLYTLEELLIYIKNNSVDEKTEWNFIVRKILFNSDQIDKFLTHANNAIESSVLYVLAAGNYEAVIRWQKKIESVILLIYPQLTRSSIIFQIKKSALYFFVINEHASIDFLKLLDDILTGISKEHILHPPTENTLIAAKYFLSMLEYELILNWGGKPNLPNLVREEGIEVAILHENAHQYISCLFQSHEFESRDIKILYGIFLEYYVVNGVLIDFSNTPFSDLNAFLSRVKAVVLADYTEWKIILKQVFTTPQRVEYFLDRSNQQIEESIVEIIAADNDHALLLWNEEIYDFLMWLYPGIEKEFVRFKIKNVIFNYILEAENISLRLFYILNGTIRLIYEKYGSAFSGSAELVTKKYLLSGKASAAFIQSLSELDIYLGDVSNTNLQLDSVHVYKENPDESVEAVLDKVAILLSENKYQEIISFIQHHINRDNDFVSSIFILNFPQTFWSYLSQSSQLNFIEKIIEKIIPSYYSYFKSLVAEIDTFSDIHDVVLKTSRDFRAVHVYFLEALNKRQSILSKEVISEILIQYYSANNDIIFKYMIDTGNGSLEKYFPEFYAVLRETYPVQKNVSVRYEKYTSLDTFRQIIQHDFPDVAGFVLLYLTALDRHRLTYARLQVVFSENTYSYIYAYLLKSKQSFSANEFIFQMNTMLAVNYKLSLNELNHGLFHISKILETEGKSQFSILSEILDNNIHIEFDSDEIRTDLSILSDELMETKTVLIKKQLSTQYQFFKKAITYYISTATFLNDPEDGFESMDDFKNYLKYFFQENAGRAYYVIRELFNDESLLQRFLTIKDSDINFYFLRELSGSRLSEFVQWKSELNAFIQFVHPTFDTSIVQSLTEKTLYNMLLQKERTTVGLFLYLKSAVDFFKKNDMNFLHDKFSESIQKFSSTEQATSLFIKALEQVELIFIQNNRKALLKKVLDNTRKEKKSEIKLEDRLLIHNAGVVLLGPFLQVYFTRLNMLDGRNFVDEVQACRAVQLVQYLATGQTYMQEHDLLLNKILCGVPIDTPIDTSFAITEQEIEISESLLNGVLSNWDKMKSSSVEALRETFLIRDGYIEQTDAGWQLEVERKSLDILVDFIPWSFSLIKLSWMDLSLTTKWVKTLGE